MKTIRQKLNSWTGTAGMVALLAFVLSACVKDTVKSNTSTATSDLAFIDASPNAPSLDLTLGGSRINANPITYGGGLDYFTAYAGKNNAIFYQDGTTTKLATDTITLLQNRSYTLFLSNLITTPDFTLIPDTITAPVGGCTIRFVNVSPNAGAVDLAIKGQSAALVSNKSYRQFSSFVAAPVNASDTLVVRQTGTTTVLAMLPGITLQTGGVYTVWLYGFAGGSSGEQLTEGIFENTSFN